MPPHSSPSAAAQSSPATKRVWSLADRAWWGYAIAGIVLADLVRRALPGDATDFRHYAAGIPLGSLIAISAYWRWRLRSSWWRAPGLGVVAALAALGIGYLKGQL